MSQTTDILQHLKAHKTIQPMEALALYGCFRLGARIWDLREDDYDIETTRFETETGARPAKYVYKGKKHG